MVRGMRTQPSTPALLVSIAAVVVSALTAAIGASPAAAADKVHTGQYWSWTGPKSWSDVQGAYGITVLGDGAATFDFGFSSTLCAPGSTYGASVENYFTAQRRALRERGWKFDAVSSIQKVTDVSPDYRRQTIEARVTNGGIQYRGVLTFDYDYLTSVDNVSYCYQASKARTAKSKAWSDVKTSLAKVERTLAYRGPGVPPED